MKFTVFYNFRSLTRESEGAAPGEKPQFLGIRFLDFIKSFSRYYFKFVKNNELIVL